MDLDSYQNQKLLKKIAGFGCQSLLLRLPDRQKLKNKLWQVHQTSSVA